MPLRWKLFRVVCIIQMLAAAILGIMAMISVFETGNFYTFIVVLTFVFIFLLTILAISIVNNNYPDVPVTGKQKSSFNRLFLINFLFLVFLFGVVFAEYRALKDIATLVNRPVFKLPFSLFIYLITNVGVLLFQFIILYGLYHLRRELYSNFMKKEFEFEKGQLL